MDTSDSEQFESADEDIQSDNDEKTFSKALTEQTIFENDPPVSSESIKYEKRENEGNNDILKSQNIFESNNSDEANLNSALITMTIDLQESSTKPDNSIKSSEDQNAISLNTTEDINDDRPIKTAKKPRNNVKSKLGTKTSKQSVKFEVLPKKETVETIKNIEPVVSVDKCEDALKNEEENLWDDEELDWGTEATQDIKTVLPADSSVLKNKGQNYVEKNDESDSWASWSNWGASVLSTATHSVSSITSQITNVIETGLGAVDPEELARIEQEEIKKKKTESVVDHGSIDQNENSYGGFGLVNLVKLVEDTGTKVISGGLDTLESIGKRTMEVLQEGDPGLKKKRAFLKIDQHKPVLSQILREAKEKADNEFSTSDLIFKKKMKNYETLFDDHHGLVHLEALELLSKQCEIKLKNLQSTMNGAEFIEFSETMDQIKELCELPDEDDEEQLSLEEIKKRLKSAVSQINIQVTYELLVEHWEEMEIWLTTIDLEICDENEVHQQAIEALAEMTSKAMEQFHKTGELLLVKERRSTADEADSLVQITATLISLIGIVAAKFCDKLNSKAAQSKEVSGLITNVFFEAANSSSYIQDALQLLIPVLQVGAT